MSHHKIWDINKILEREETKLWHASPAQIFAEYLTSVPEKRKSYQNGPEHSKQFTVVAYINNNEVGRGSATTKKSAEMLAAKAALNLFGVKV